MSYTVNPETVVAEMFAALANPNRLSIVRFLRDGERCQCEIPDALDIEQSNLSRHIKLLVDAGVLTARRDGKKVMLSICNHVVLDVIDTFEELVKERANNMLLAMA